MATYIKNPSMCPATGGYIVRYDRYCQSADAYDGLRYMDQGQEIFEDGQDALARLDELAGQAESHSTAMEKIKANKAKEKDKAKS